MEMSEAENFLAGFCDVVNPIKKPRAVYVHPVEKLQDALIFSLSIRDGLDRKPGCKTDGLMMSNPVAKLIDMVQFIENVLVVISGRLQHTEDRNTYISICRTPSPPSVWLGCMLHLP